MEKLELQNELNQMIEQMPEALVREILDFAEFLLIKKTTLMTRCAMCQETRLITWKKSF